MKKTITIGKGLGGPKKTPVESKRTVGELELKDGLDGLHVGGVAIEDLDPVLRSRLLFQQTDEGIAENDLGKVTGAARVTQDASSKAIRRKRDFGLEDPDASMDLDPAQALVDEHVAPGMHPRFLSKARLNKEGGQLRGFEIVKDRDGKDVTFGSMVLAQMPEDVAHKRRERRREHGNVPMREIYNGAIERGGGLIRTDRHTQEDMGFIPERDTDRQYEQA